jgi:hypothetical protein
MRLPCANTRMSRGWRAFTLAETMIASATLVIVMGSVIACNLFGLSMAARQQIWLDASDDAAQAVGTMMQDIRSATILAVGTYSNNVFNQTPGNVQQSGNALMICTNSPTPGNAPPWAPYSYILYYYDSVSNNLVRVNYNGAGVAGDFKLVSANPITNDYVNPIFTEVSCTQSSGNMINTPLTNAAPLAAISIYLSFTKLQNSQVIIESGSAVDLYQIIATVSPRMKL